MVWIGLLVGICVGAMVAGGGGVIPFGIVGAVVGLVIKWNKAAAEGAEVAPIRNDTPQEQIDRLHTALAHLQQRVVRLETELELQARPREAPLPTRKEVTPPAEAPPAPIVAPVPEPIPEPIVAKTAEVSPPVVEQQVTPPLEPESVAAEVAPPPEPEPVAAESPPPLEPERFEAESPPPPPEPGPVASDAPTPPRETEQPRPPWSGLLDRLLEGNLVAKVGVVILFFGFAFLLKFAYDRGLFPPGLRLLAVAAASAAMFFVGRKLLAANRTYAVILMGGAMGLAYLDVFFALKTFQLIGPPTAFALFALLGVATLFLAVRLEARAVAVLGLLGGFLAPVLASSGGGNHVLLFSYYLLLNLVIVATSWFRSWRELNFVGFLFTFAIAVLWGNTSYRPEHFATVEPFLLAFFSLYLAIPILFAYRQPPQLRGVVDATLVFGMPLSAAMMQSALTRGMGDQVLAWSAALAAILYAVLARVLWNRPNMRLLAEAHVALAIVFGTVAPYFAFEGVPTFAFWTVEGAAIYWIGCRQQRGLARTFALLLQLGAAPYFVWVTADSVAAHAIWNDRVIGCLLIGAASLATAWLVRRFQEVVTLVERQLEGWIVAWAIAWLLIGANLAIRHTWSVPLERLSALLIVIAVVLAVAEYAGTRLAWWRLRAASMAHVPLMTGVAIGWFLDANGATHPLASGGAFAWPLAFAVHFHLVHRQRRDEVLPWPAITYLGAWILLGLLATWEASWRWTHGENAWVFAIGATGLVAAGLRFWLRERGVASAAAVSGWIVAWSLVWWFGGLFGLVEERVDPVHRLAAFMGIVAFSVLLFELIGRRLEWMALRRAQLLLPLAALAAVLATFAQKSHPFAFYTGWAWATMLGIHWFTVRRDGALAADFQRAFVVATVALLATWEAAWRWSQDQYGWVFAFGIAGLGVAGLRARLREEGATTVPQASGLLVVWSLVWWFGGLHGFIDESVAPAHRVAANLAMVAASVLLFELVGRALAWKELRWVQLVLPVALVLAAGAVWIGADHPFAGVRTWVWLGSFAGAWFVLHRQERDGIAVVPAAQHVGLFAGLLLLLFWEAHWRLDRAAFSPAWRVAAMGGVAAGGLAVVTLGIGRSRWPFSTHAQAFRTAVLYPLLVLALMWSVAVLGSDGDARPWAYLPILNPIDLAQLALFAAAAAAMRPGGPAAKFDAHKLFVATAFLWVNAAVLRTVHHWADVPFELGALMRSVVAQAALSLLWTATALVLMFLAGRRKARAQWMVGAALLALVIAKLFLNDLGNSGTVARIVSFIGVGVFMLVIGYISPVPPRREERSDP